MENFLTPACDYCGSPVPNHNRACPKWDCPSCAALRAELEKAEERIKWYVDYANGKDRDVCSEMERANKAESDLARLREAVEWMDTALSSCETMYGGEMWANIRTVMIGFRAELRRRVSGKEKE